MIAIRVVSSISSSSSIWMSVLEVAKCMSEVVGVQRFITMSSQTRYKIHTEIMMGRNKWHFACTLHTILRP